MINSFFFKNKYKNIFSLKSAKKYELYSTQALKQQSYKKKRVFVVSVLSPKLIFNSLHMKTALLFALKFNLWSF